MMFYIKSIVTIRIGGISGPFIQTVSWLVNAEDVNQARQKYESKVKRDYSHMNFSSINFEYTEVAGTIQ